MTGDVVNLKRARKARARAGREAEAAVRRAEFGRSKAERALSEARHRLANRKLDGLRIEKPTVPECPET
jgi:hypothetical protein